MSTNDETTNKNEGTLLKDVGSSSRFVDYTFGRVEVNGLTVTGDFQLSGIAMGNPIDGGTVNIPPNVAIVIIQSTLPYTSLTFNMPSQPNYGKILSIVSTVDIATVAFTNALFGTAAVTTMKNSVPLRFVFAGSWFRI